MLCPYCKNYFECVCPIHFIYIYIYIYVYIKRHEYIYQCVGLTQC